MSPLQIPRRHRSAIARSAQGAWRTCGGARQQSVRHDYRRFGLRRLNVTPRWNFVAARALCDIRWCRLIGDVPGSEGVMSKTKLFTIAAVFAVLACSAVAAPR